jgi:hypothetical protein
MAQSLRITLLRLVTTSQMAEKLVSVWGSSGSGSEPTNTLFEALTRFHSSPSTFDIDTLREAREVLRVLNLSRSFSRSNLVRVRRFLVDLAEGPDLVSPSLSLRSGASKFMTRSIDIATASMQQQQQFQQSQQMDTTLMSAGNMSLDYIGGSNSNINTGASSSLFNQATNSAAFDTATMSEDGGGTATYYGGSNLMRFWDIPTIVEAYGSMCFIEAFEYLLASQGMGGCNFAFPETDSSSARIDPDVYTLLSILQWTRNVMFAPVDAPERSRLIVRTACLCSLVLAYAIRIDPTWMTRCSLGKIFKDVLLGGSTSSGNLAGFSPSRHIPISLRTNSLSGNNMMLIASPVAGLMGSSMIGGGTTTNFGGGNTTTTTTTTVGVLEAVVNALVLNFEGNEFVDEIRLVGNTKDAIEKMVGGKSSSLPNHTIKPPSSPMMKMIEQQQQQSPTTTTTTTTIWLTSQYSESSNRRGDHFIVLDFAERTSQCLKKRIPNWPELITRYPDWKDRFLSSSKNSSSKKISKQPDQAAQIIIGASSRGEDSQQVWLLVNEVKQAIDHLCEQIQKHPHELMIGGVGDTASLAFSVALLSAQEGRVFKRVYMLTPTPLLLSDVLVESLGSNVVLKLPKIICVDSEDSIQSQLFVEAIRCVVTPSFPGEEIAVLVGVRNDEMMSDALDKLLMES